MSEDQSSNEPLKGHTFVFTGDMSMDRDAAKSKVVLLGARCTTAVSSKTTHLVTGNEPGPAKLEKAKELGVKIVNEDEFNDLLNKHASKMNREFQTITENTSLENKEQIVQEKKPWSEKYRPQNADRILGHNSTIEQLKAFIRGETEYKAALLSGSPGVGKTTTALAVCRDLGFIPVEFNASDLRSKKALNDTISGNVSSKASLSSATGISKKVVIMDEVDGMSSDRGGIPELISVIKQSKIPIVCICNDKSHPKMRTLAGYCLDLHFKKLDGRTILPRIKEILKEEGRILPDGIINDVILNSNGDMRYVLNTVQNISAKGTVSAESVKNLLSKKNVSKNTFEIASEMFQRKAISDKIDLYFEEYDLMPLFVHENYPKCTFKSFKDFLNSAESVSFSDLIDSRIHGSEQEWALMPYHAFFSCVNPLRTLSLSRRLDFPAYLGQNSKSLKNGRLLSEVCRHLKQKISRKTLRLYAGETLFRRFIECATVGDIKECLKILVETDLLKDDLMSLEDILGLDLSKAISSKNKSALTREYNKLDRHLPYTVTKEVTGDDNDE